MVFFKSGIMKRDLTEIQKKILDYLIDQIKGKGMHRLKKPIHILDAGNSGTTIRLLSGLLSGQQFNTVITGDNSFFEYLFDVNCAILSRMIFLLTTGKSSILNQPTRMRYSD